MVVRRPVARDSGRGLGGSLAHRASPRDLEDMRDIELVLQSVVAWARLWVLPLEALPEERLVGVWGQPTVG